MLQLNLNSMQVHNTLSFTWEILKQLSTTMRGRKTSEFFFCWKVSQFLVN